METWGLTVMERNGHKALYIGLSRNRNLLRVNQVIVYPIDIVKFYIKLINN